MTRDHIAERPRPMCFTADVELEIFGPGPNLHGQRGALRRPDAGHNYHRAARRELRADRGTDAAVTSDPTPDRHAGEWPHAPLPAIR